MLDVVISRPQHFHGPAGVPCELDCLQDEVDLELSPERAGRDLTLTVLKSSSRSLRTRSDASRPSRLDSGVARPFMDSRRGVAALSSGIEDSYGRPDLLGVWYVR